MVPTTEAAHAVVVQAIERARSEVRQAEGAAHSLAELCDSLRGDEADLRERLAGLRSGVAAAEREASDADAGRATACQVDTQHEYSSQGVVKSQGTASFPRPAPECRRQGKLLLQVGQLILPRG